ncbi:MAG: superoxide dismutase family protein [Gemmatimonadetes bacterium]|uniref:Superoxide dismutase [Cu-Zn] n=1 Tax=Candidatus Kutchimonas denitrificans TaxID=3056748 RepID=A0AAE4Z8A6_9BACT|nr:superoxide dismutase family protein [Gemmatimonadota bacterium]NIR75665.1 superoxide dismutase family protein [Candidatus Kutchimonas denitrificans]NIR99644.1 superoxide dismutase family protein [Gemmatimonadota bacterium]NIT65919.1 superoxide dismutase family protein [Gemmatimonadota bacterium]NIV22088.1 superoxide dismutase family protein [Gemmatimonadota bacterium]
MREKRYLASAIVLALSAAGIAGAASDGARLPDSAEKIEGAVAVLHPTEGNEARGIVTFQRADGGIKIGANIEGLAPGKHGFHIHELGNCSAPDGTSAGGHFNPEGMPHGAPSDEERHVGDLGNLTAVESGRADYERTDSHIAFEGTHSIIGRAVIVHAGEDDLTSQPSGDAGPRVACGVIGIARVAGGM